MEERGGSEATKLVACLMGWHGNVMFVVTEVWPSPRLHSSMFLVGLGMESNTQFTLQIKATALWVFPHCKRNGQCYCNPECKDLVTRSSITKDCNKRFSD